jgi:tetratricopeptide (TPR) repeat protein
MTDGAIEIGSDLVGELARQQMIHARQQFAQYLATQDRGQLDEAITAAEAAIELVQQTAPPELIAYFRVAEQWRLYRWLLERRSADLDAIVGRCARIDAVPSAGPAEDAVHQTAAAQAYEGRFHERGDRADLDEAVRRWGLAVEASGADDPVLEIRRAGLARAEQARLAMADEQLQSALDLELPGDDEDALDLRVRALGFLMRYRMGGPQGDVDHAVDLLERARSAARDAESIAGTEKLLGDAAMLQAERGGGNPADIENAIRHYTTALNAVSGDAGQDAERFTEDLARLVNAHTDRVVSTGDRAHVEEALQVLNQHAADERLTPADRGQLWTSMTAMLQRLARHTGRQEDLTAAVGAARKAVEATVGTSAEPQALSQLATSLSLEYELFSQMTCLAEAAATATRAAEMSAGSDPARTLRLLNAATMWFLLGEREGDAGQIDSALELLAEPARTPDEHQSMALLRTQMCWGSRYDITGELADLDAAVAAGLTARDSPLRHGPYGELSAAFLSDALTTRGLRTNSTDDADHALRIGAAVLDTLPPGHPDVPARLFRLRAEPARHRFTISGESTDLDAAVNAAEEALGIATRDTDVTAITLGLGGILRTRFEETGDEADLRSAAAYYRALAGRLPLPDPAAFAALLELAGTLRRLFGSSSAAADAQEAIARAREVATRPDTEPATAIRAWTVLCETTTDLAVASPGSASPGDAVRAGEAAVAAAAGHRLLPEARLALAQARYAHYLRERSETLFERAAGDLAAIVGQSTDDAARAYAYAQLGRLHRARHAERQAPEDLGRAIEFLDRAVTTAGRESPRTAAYARELYDLRARRTTSPPAPAEATPAARHAAAAETLLARFAADRDQTTLSAAISAWFAAASADPDRHGPGLLAALSSSGSTAGELRLLHELYYRLATAPADPERPGQSVMLVVLLHRHWRETLRPDAEQALRDAIAVLREAGGTGTDFLLAAGETLHDLFTLTGDQPTLHTAIAALGDFIAGADEDPRRDEVARRLDSARDQIHDPLNAPRSAADLAHARWQLEPVAERAHDLLAATELAAAAVPPGHPERPSLVGNVANAALLVASLTHEPGTYPRAVTAARAAAAAVQDSAEPDGMLRDKAAAFLAVALLLGLREHYDPEPADEAARLATGLLGHPQLGFQARTVLAELLLLGQSQDDVGGEPAVLHRAVRYAREAMELVPETDPDHRAARELLIKALLRRFVTVRDTGDLTEALRHTGDLPPDSGNEMGRLLAGLPDDGGERQEAGELLAGLGPEAAAQLADEATGLAMIIAEDDHAEWLLTLRACLAAAEMHYGRQRFLLTIAGKVRQNRPALALRLLRQVASELGAPEDEDGQRGAAEAWSMIGQLTEEAEQWDEAFAAYERAMELYRVLGEPRREVERLRDMAVTSSSRDNGAVAAGYYDQAIRRAAEAGLTDVEPELLMLSVSAVDPVVAMARIEQARDRFVALGEPDKAATAHGSLAFLAIDRGDAAEVVRQVEAAAGLAASADMVERTYQMVWQAMVGKGLGAQAHALEEGLAARMRPPGPRQAADHLYNFARYRHDSGDAPGALISYRAARAEYLAQGNRDATASVDVRIGALHAETGEIDEAISVCEGAGAEFAQIGNWEKASTSYLNAAACRRSRAMKAPDHAEPTDIAEELREAAGNLAAAADYADRSANRTALFAVRVEQARLEAERRRPEETAGHLAEAERLADGNPGLLGILDEARARAAQLTADTHAEQDALERAMDHFQQAGRPRAAAGVAARLAAILEEDGDLRRARTLVQYAIDNIDAAEPSQPFTRIIGSDSSLPQALHSRAATLDIRLGRLGPAWDNLTRTAPRDDHGHVLSAILAIEQASARNDLRTALEMGQRTLGESEDPRLRSVLLRGLSAHARELGELQLAYDYAAQGVALAEAEGGSLTENLRMLGSASRELGRASEAVTHLRRAAGLAEQDGQDQLGLADIRNSLALALIDHGDLGEAERILARGLESARAMSQRRSEASLLSTRAALSLRRGDLDAASTGYRDAIRIQEDLGDTRALAGEYANLGLVLLRQGDQAEARALTELALDAERRSGRRTGVALDLIALADLEEPDIAAERLGEALAISRETGFASGTGLALAALGTLNLQHAEPAAARDRLSEAIEVFEQIGDISHLADTYHNRSSALELLGDLPAALRDEEEADRLWRLLDSGLESSSSRSRLAADHLITLCTKAGRATDVWRYVERDKARDLLARLNTGDLPAPSAPGELLDRETSLLRQLQALQTDATGAPEPARRAATTRRLARVREALEAVWAELAASEPDYAALRSATAPARDDLDLIVAGGRVGLLGFHLGESQTTVLIYGGSQAEPAARRAWRLPDGVLESVRQAHGGEVPVLIREPDGREGQADARFLIAVTMLDEGVEALGKNMDLLYLLPHGRLHQLPLHTLPVSEGNALLDRVPVAYAPSAGVLARLRARPRPAGPRPSRVLGYAPQEPGEARALIEGTAADTATALGTEARYGTAATRDLLAGNWHVLHLSCHGEFDEHDPFGSGVRLADGLLTAREIMGMRIDADLVVLAACETGQSGPHGGVDIAGLGYALLHAGARCSLLTLWPVDAAVTRTVMSLFYARLVTGQPAGAALREALMELRRTPGHDDPAVWGAYVLMGDAS